MLEPTLSSLQYTHWPSSPYSHETRHLPSTILCRPSLFPLRHDPAPTPFFLTRILEKAVAILNLLIRISFSGSSSSLREIWPSPGWRQPKINKISWLGWPMEEDREHSLRKARKGATPVPAATRLGLDFWVPAKVELQMDIALVCRKHLEELARYCD
jgi:hypothetical protein